MSLLRSYLESNAILGASDLEAAARHSQAQGGSLDTALLELGLLTAAELLTHLHGACGIPVVPARLLETGPTRPTGHVPKAMLDIGWVLPLALEDGDVLCAVHPDLPDARLGQLYRQIRGFRPLVAPECCLAKLNAERTGSIVAPRFAMLVLDVLDALESQSKSGTTLVGVPVATPAPPASPPAPAAPEPASANAPVAPAPAAFTIPYAAAGPQIAVHTDGPAGPPPPVRPAPQPTPPAADSISATVVEPVLDDSLTDGVFDSLTAGETISQPIPDPAVGGTFPVTRSDSAPLVAASSGTFTSDDHARAAARKDSQPAAKASGSAAPTPAPRDSQPAAPDPKDSPAAAAAAPAPKDSPAAAAAPAPKDSPAAAATPAPKDSPVAAPAPKDSPAAPDPKDSRPLAVAAAQDPRGGAPDRRRPPSGTTAAPVPQDSRPAEPAPSPTSRQHTRSGGVSTARTAPLPQLPLAQRLAPARAALAQARERDRITESLVRAAIQVAPRVALFGVKREGLRALAAPGSSLHLPRSLVIPIPDGSLLDRAVSGEIRLRLLTEPQLAFAVGRPLGIPCILEPVYAQNRCVLMLYIDRSGGPFELGEQTAVRDLCEVARSSLEALLRIMGLGNREPAGLLVRSDGPADPAQPEPAADPSPYVAAPERAPSADAWLARHAPTASEAHAAAKAAPDAKSDPSPIDAADAKSDPSPADAGAEPAPAEPTTPKSEPSASRAPESDGVPELTRRPRRAVIALVNPIRREPASKEPARGWIAARDQYSEFPGPEPAGEADVPTTNDPQAPTRRLPAADSDPSVAPDSPAAPAAPVPPDSPAAPAAPVPPDSPAAPAAIAQADTAAAAAPAAPVPPDSPAAVAVDTVATAPPAELAAPVPTDSADSVTPSATAATTADAAPAATDSPAELEPADAAPPDSPDAATTVSADSDPAVDNSAPPADASAASTDAPAPAPATVSADALPPAEAAPVPTDSSASTSDAPVPADSQSAAAPAPKDSPTAAAPAPKDSPTAADAPVPADSPSSVTTAPADAAAPADAPQATRPPADDDANPDPSASTSGLHMPNLVAPGVKRSAGKRGDRTRPVEPAVVIPYDLRRPEHRTSPPRTAKPRPAVQIPASLLAPAPLPGSARKGKSPQHPTPPRAEDVTLNMPMLVRAPTSLPPEPAAPETNPPDPSTMPELATTTLLEIQPLAEPAPADPAPTPAEPASDLAQTPAEPAADLTSRPSGPDLAQAPAEPAADLSQAPSAPEAAPPAAPQDPDEALAAYLHDQSDAALAALVALGPAVYPRIAARFPGPIDPHSASDVRSFPPPSVHGPLLRACVEIGEAITPHILELLDHQRPQIRFYAAFLFQELRDPRCLRPLAHHAFDPDPDVRLIATRVLESFNRTPGFVAATEHVRAALGGRDRDRALLATEATGTLRDTRAVPTLIELLSVRDKQIREASLEALCSITAKHHGYRPAKWRSWYADHGEQPRIVWVMDALKHRDPAVRRWAADELTRVTGHRIPPPAAGEKITPRYVLEAWEAWWDHTGAAQFS